MKYEVVIETVSGKTHLYKIDERSKANLESLFIDPKPPIGKWLSVDGEFISIDNVERVYFRGGH